VSTSLELRDIVVEQRPRFVRGRGTRPLDGLSLQVADGEVVTVAGPSGFGGTTLARVVVGILTPKSGTVHVDGVEMTGLPPAQRPVGLIPAGGGLLPHLTSAENIAYGMRLRKETRAVARNRLATAVERLQLRPSLALRPHELSPGQRIRTALARVAVRPVHALVVDATAGAQGLTQLRRLIDRTWPEAAISVLVCTHDPAVVEQADRLVVLADGRAGSCGAPSQLRSAPPNLTTARLVYPEPMGELFGVVRGGEIDCNGFRLPAPSRVPDGRFVLVALPATALRLVPPGQGLAGQIVSVGPTDDVVRVLVQPAAWPRERWAIEHGGRRRPRPGDGVGIEIAVDRLLVFDIQAAEISLLTPPLPG
jgi:multiple sugar transport system ATP-binding protein